MKSAHLFTRQKLRLAWKTGARQQQLSYAH